MGRRGPAKQPTNLALLRGETRPSRVNLNEPKPGQSPIDPPRELGDRELAVWCRLAPDLIRKGVLTAWDVDTFATFCQMVIVNADASENVGLHGTSITTVARELSDGTIIYDLRKNPAWQVMRESAAAIVTLGGRFGLNPSDRSQLSFGEAPREPGADLLSG